MRIILISVLLLSGSGCSNFRNTAAKTFEGVRRAAITTREIIPTHCGVGGEKFFDLCNIGNKDACESFKNCHVALKTVESALVGVLAGQLVLLSGQEDDKVEAALRDAVFFALELKKVLSTWGVSL